MAGNLNRFLQFDGGGLNRVGQLDRHITGFKYGNCLIAGPSVAVILVSDLEREGADRESVVGHEGDPVNLAIAADGAVERAQVDEHDHAFVLAQFAMFSAYQRVSDGQIRLPAPAEHCRELDVESSLIGSSADDDECRIHRVVRFRRVEVESLGRRKWSPLVELGA